MYLQQVEAITKIRWDNITYGDVHLQGEIEQCTYNFEASNPDMLLTLFGLTSRRQSNCLSEDLPSLDYILKCSHTSNLDARGVLL